MADLGYFRRQQLIKEVAATIAQMQGWKSKELNPVSMNTSLVEEDDSSEEVIPVTVSPYGGIARFNHYYDIAEKVVDMVSDAIAEDEDVEIDG